MPCRAHSSWRPLTQRVESVPAPPIRRCQDAKSDPNDAVRAAREALSREQLVVRRSPLAVRGSGWTRRVSRVARQQHGTICW